jgi:hypothetical protein
MSTENTSTSNAASGASGNGITNVAQNAINAGKSACQIPVKVVADEENLKVYVCKDNETPTCSSASSGGKKKAAAKPKKVFYNKSTRASVVYIDGPSKRKFIKVAGSVIFLDTVRGKYRYAK